jgi:hypothetical protein
MTAATTERTRLESLRAKEAELAIEVDAARARISEYPALLHDARSRAVYAKPNVRPGKELDGEVAKITTRERKDLAALNGLEGDLSAVRSVLAIEAQRESERVADAARKQLAERHELEESAWTKAGSVFAELADAWEQYVTIAEESISYASSNGLNASDALAVIPAPASFKEFVALLLKASTDAEVHAEPFTEQLIDSGVFRTEHGGAVYDVRPAGTRTTEVRRRLDERDRLFHLVPDLRPVVRAPKG